MEEERKKLNILLRQNILMENQKISLPLRYQAYERLSLLLERMHPIQLIARNQITDVSANQYREILITAINVEVQYNLTQQIYVSADIWKLINQIKKQMQVLLNEIAAALPEEASAQDFSNAVHQYFEDIDDDKIPINIGLKYLRNEVATMH